MSKNIVNELYKRPRKLLKGDYAKYSYIKPDYEIEIDLLTLPDDKGYKYALVVADVGSRKVDAEPLKNKEAKTVLEGLMTIFNRGHVKKPKKQIDFDRGTEFKGVFKKFMKDNNLIAKKSVANKKHHNPLAEAINGVIGEFLFKRMAREEVQNKKTNKSWVKYLNVIVNKLNKTAFIRRVAPPKNENPKTVDNKDVRLAFEIGDVVRIKKEVPTTIVDERQLFGKIRRTDPKWSSNTYKVVNVLMYPQQPVRYQIDDGKDTIYYEKELQKSNYQGIDDPNNPKNMYVVEKLIDKRKEGRIIQFLVKWKGYKQATWEPRARLIEDGFKEEIKEFERKKK